MLLLKNVLMKKIGNNFMIWHIMSGNFGWMVQESDHYCKKIVEICYPPCYLWSGFSSASPAAEAILLPNPRENLQYSLCSNQKYY
jgi:hypothetical protein